GDLQESFQQVLQGQYRITKHLMLEAVIEDDLPNSERQAASGTEAQRFLALNEIVVHTMPPFHILDLELEVEGMAVSRFSGDGLIVSTPVGSTAHNLSAGGPILGQELQAFVITPICPHTLTYRPVVVAANKSYTIRLSKEDAEAVAIIDGQE